MRRGGKPPKPAQPEGPPLPPTAPQLLMTSQLQMSIRLLELPLRELADEVRRLAKETAALRLGEPAGPRKELPLPADGIAPDLLIVKDGAKWKAIASAQGLPALTVAEGAKEADAQAALWLIQSLEKRTEALEAFGEALISLFPDFVATGAPFKAARATKFSDTMQLHESTVKRLTAGKRLQLSHGTYALAPFVQGAPKPG